MKLSLVNLFLSSNKVSSVPDISDMAKLHRLFLSDNDLTDKGISGLPASLVYLYLDNNLLNKVPKAVSNLTNLLVLHLGSNLLRSIDNFEFPENLQQLYLWGNQNIDVFKTVKFVNNVAGNLEVLSLGEGPLKFIMDNALDNVQGLMSFSARNASLSSVPMAVTKLKHLTDLDLSYNNITSIDNVEFSSSLLTLRLEYNQIATLTSVKMKDDVSQLIDLYLQGNPLTVISPDAFKSTPGLRILFLSNTRLTRLPLALLALREPTLLVGFLDVPTLVCSCGESALVGWYHSLASVQVAGKCGVADVTDFLETIGKSCPV